MSRPVVPERKVACRAQVSERCMDGWPEVEAYVAADGLKTDTTWNGRSVVCDHCYLELGCPDPREL